MLTDDSQKEIVLQGVAESGVGKLGSEERKPFESEESGVLEEQESGRQPGEQNTLAHTAFETYNKHTGSLDLDALSVILLQVEQVYAVEQWLACSFETQAVAF